MSVWGLNLIEPSISSEIWFSSALTHQQCCFPIKEASQSLALVGIYSLDNFILSFSSSNFPVCARETAHGVEATVISFA